MVHRCSKQVKVIGLMGFDLLAAFYTVCKEQLLPKLAAIGVTGKALEWFSSFMSNGKQSVVWDSVVSDILDVLYGVRQRLILGPLLYLVIVADLPSFLRLWDSDGNSAYANTLVSGSLGTALPRSRASSRGWRMSSLPSPKGMVWPSMAGRPSSLSAAA